MPVAAGHDVQTMMNYYKPLDGGAEAPYFYIYEPPPGVAKTNIGLEERPVVVHDVRHTAMETDASLDVHGFRYVKQESTEKEFVDEERIRDVYYREAEGLLKREVPGAKSVYIFDHTIRRLAEDPVMRGNGRGPAQRVHVDQTFEASAKRVRRHLSERADILLQSRFRLINIWRPIANPVAHTPLGIVDWRTIDPSRDLVASRHIYPTFEGATFNVRPNKSHKWWYMSEQTPDECLLIKCYDSEERGGVARAVPHSAFVDPESDEGKPKRQSIELRCLVFDSE